MIFVDDILDDDFVKRVEDEANSPRIPVSKRIDMKKSNDFMKKFEKPSRHEKKPEHVKKPVPKTKIELE